MREVQPEEMIASQLYYIQSPVISGNGRQKGIFMEVKNPPLYGYPPYNFPFARFEKVENFTPCASGYATGIRWFRCDLCKFYLFEKEAIVERVMVNAVLREIIGDPSFFYYPVEKSYPRGTSILVNNWLSEKDIHVKINY